MEAMMNLPPKLSTEYDDDCGATFGKVTKLSV
jgi:hypothetical protein